MHKLPQSTVSGLHPLVGHAYSVHDSSFLLENESIENGLIEIKLNPNSDKTILVSGGSTSDIYYDGSWLRPFSGLVHDKFKSIFSCACAGYSTSQELLRILECINALKPDIVISLNGVNDFGLIQSPQRSYPYIHSFQSRLYDYIARNKDFQGKSLRRISSDLEKREVTKYPSLDDDCGFNSWSQNISIMNFVAMYNGAEMYSFLQPCLGYGALEPERDSLEEYYLSKLVADREWYLLKMRDFYDKAVHFCGESSFAVDFTSVLGNSPTNLFQDCRHLNPLGNLHLAKAIYAMVT